MKKKINKDGYEMEKLGIESSILHFKISQNLGTWHDEEELKEHRTNLRKLEAMKIQETKEWKEKWLRI